MWDWLPATILGIAIMPFAIGMAAFVFWWIFLTYEPVYVRNYNGYYDYTEYKGSLLWGILGTAFLVWFVYTLMGGVSWEKFLAFYPGFLILSAKWLSAGLVWAIVRWIVEAYRGRKNWDRNAQWVANKKYRGEVANLTESDKYDLSKDLPKASKYRWRFFRWMLLWPMSLLDTFFRDLVKLIWEWIYNLVSMFLDMLARMVYGHRYVAAKPANYEESD